MSLSNEIARMLMEMLEQDGTTEIQRNELAQTLGCVPSQINYVISSRFTPEHGYIVESRRGGGGYIKITRVSFDKPSAIMHTVNHVGDDIDFSVCRAHVMNLLNAGVIDKNSARLIAAATGIMHCVCFRRKSGAESERRYSSRCFLQSIQRDKKKG